MVIRDRNITSHAISLGGRTFRLRGNPQRRLISQLPGKVTLGDWTNESNPIASVRSWTDRRGGVGTENDDPDAGQDKTWFSTASLRHNKHHVLQRRAVATAVNAGIGSDETVQFVAELASTIFAIAGSKIYLYADSTDTWGSSLNTFAGAPTDVVTCPLNGVETLVVAQSGTGVDFTTDGSSWTNETVTTTDIAFMAWDVARSFLWGIDTSGATYFTANLANGWTQTATMRLRQGEPTRLLFGPGPADEDLLYSATQIGLHVYDNANSRWIATRRQLPFHDQNGTGSVVFDESIFINSGLAVYKYSPGQEGITTQVGPDRFDGIPQLYQGATRAMAATHTELFLFIDGSNTAGASDATEGGTFTDGIHTGQRLGSGGGKSSIMGWNTLGWEFKWTSDIAGEVATANMLVSNSYNSYRLWWGSGSTIYYMVLPIGIENPNQVTNAQREPSSSTTEPLFDAGVDNQTRTALAWIIDSQHPSSAEQITLKYQVNSDDSDSALTTVVTKKTSGVVTYPLPDAENQEGVPFSNIGPIVDMVRGPILTNTPDLLRLSLIYKKAIKPMWGWDLVMNMTHSEQGYTPEEQRDFVESLIDADLKGDRLQQYTSKDEEDNDQNYWVFVLAAQADEATGYDDEAFWRITIAEAR